MSTEILGRETHSVVFCVKRSFKRLEQPFLVAPGVEPEPERANLEGGTDERIHPLAERCEALDPDAGEDRDREQREARPGGGPRPLLPIPGQLGRQCRKRPAAGLLHHSDQASPYASEDYQDVLARDGMTGSMSRRGNCYDNAVMETWFSTVKTELGEHFDRCGEAKMELFDYIEVFYNQQRRHSTLG